MCLISRKLPVKIKRIIQKANNQHHKTVFNPPIRLRKRKIKV